MRDNPPCLARAVYILAEVNEWQAVLTSTDVVQEAYACRDLDFLRVLGPWTAIQIYGNLDRSLARLPGDGGASGRHDGRINKGKQKIPCC